MNVRDRAARVEAVRNVILAARALAESRHEGLAQAVATSTGLSLEGVDLVFRKHLELDPSDADLDAFVTRAGEASSVAVILSANVFSAALRAVALARAASEDVVVRTSRRDPVFARALVSVLRARGDRAVRIDEALDPASIHSGEIHVYGRDETIAAVRRATTARVRGHGSGMGIAWITSRAALDLAAKSLAEDVVAFDQRGCLSPRVAIVVGPESRARTFAEALHAHLDRLDLEIPRGLVGPEDRAEIARYVDTMTFAASVLVSSTHTVGIAAPGMPLVLPPPFRNVHVAHVSSVDAGRAVLAPFARGIVTLGSDDRGEASSVAPSWARLSALGSMQRPPLDGPVDFRTT